MRVSFAAFTAAAAALSLAACAQPAPEAPVVDESGCIKPETGIIRPESPGVSAAPLSGPFLVKSLMIGVDPANPQTFGSLLWSKTQTWFTVHDFSGPFYLGADENLSAAEGRSPYATIYFGCRLE